MTDKTMTLEEARRYANGHAARIERTDPYFASVLRLLLASEASAVAKVEEADQRRDEAVRGVVQYVSRWLRERANSIEGRYIGSGYGFLNQAAAILEDGKTLAAFINREKGHD